MDTLVRLKVLLDSSTPIVVMETVEEVRAIRLVRSAASALNLATFEWSIADGLCRSGGNPLEQFDSGHIAAMEVAAENGAKGMYNTTNPAQALSNLAAMSVEAVFILKDFHRHMDDPVVVRRLRDVAQKFSENRRTIVITAPALTVPPELGSLVEFLELPLPDKKRLRQIIDEVVVRLGKSRTLKRTLDAAGYDAAVENLRGLTEEEADRATSQAIVTRYGLTAEFVSDVLVAKQDTLRRTKMLDFVEASDTLADVGGLENLKQWLALRRGSWDDSAQRFGLDSPKGMIILGVQGCGKSLCARGVAGEWKLPLVKFDTAAVFDKYIGETEKRIQKVFKVAEGLSPCVLWIDELEKIFAGSGPESASVDAGVSSRILAAFLSWMQDKKAPVFVAATCNNVMALPPELIRKGRFDELFFVDLPNHSERVQIFSIQLVKRKQRSEGFNLARLAAESDGHSGAEINAAIQSALFESYSTRKPLSTDMIVAAVKASVPLSVSRAEEIESLRDWAKSRAVPASAPAQYDQAMAEAATRV